LKQGVPRAAFWLWAAVATFVVFVVVWAAWAYWYYGVMWDYCEPDRRFRNKPGISCARGWYTFAVWLFGAVGATALTPPLWIAVSRYRRTRRDAIRGSRDEEAS
jgi:hypothetical protein